MTEREEGSVDIEVLNRMIAYVREEAIRLRVMDVALLLEHAQAAVTAFAPGTTVGRRAFKLARDADSMKH